MTAVLSVQILCTAKIPSAYRSSNSTYLFFIWISLPFSKLITQIIRNQAGNFRFLRFCSHFKGNISLKGKILQTQACFVCQFFFHNFIILCLKSTSVQIWIFYHLSLVLNLLSILKGRKFFLEKYHYKLYNQKRVRFLMGCLTFGRIFHYAHSKW